MSIEVPIQGLGYQPLIIRKLADQTINNSDTLTDDTALQFTAAANAVYVIELFMKISIKAASDFKYTFVIPASATIIGNAHTVGPTWTSGAQLNVSVDLAATRTILQASNVDLIWNPVMAWLETAGTAGLVKFQWAQNTAAVEDTIVKAGSLLRVTKVV